MSTKNDPRKPEARMDPANLYKEEVFTDRSTGTVRRLSPVKPDGSHDAGRPSIYIGEAQLLTSAGALPLSFEIDAQTLEEAAMKYGEGVKRAYEEALQEFQEMRRRASSSLVIPEAGAGLGGLTGGMGGMPGAGKLQLP